MTRPNTSATERQLANISRDAPFVVWARLLDMTSIAAPRAADRREWNRMTGEKVSAAQEAWMAMAGELFAAQQRAWAAAARMAWGPWQPDLPVQAWYRGLADLDAVLAAGLKPAARRVGGNARRLRKRG